MANRNKDQSWCIGKGLIEISGSFVCLAGAGTVVAANVKGQGFGYAPQNGVMTLQTGIVRPGITTTPGILRTGVGTYTVTLDDSYIDCIDFDCNLATTGASGNWAQPEFVITNLATSGKGPTFTLYTVNSAGTASDFGVTNRVYFYMLLRDSTVGYGKP